MPDEAAIVCDKFGVTLDYIYRGKMEHLPHRLMVEISSRMDDIKRAESEAKSE